MADLPALPTPGQKPWSLNPHITAINAELNGRLSGATLEGNTLALTDAQPVQGLVSGSSGESANRAIIQGLLDNPAYKRIFVPEGEWYVGYLTIPAGKELSGVFSRAYTTIPTTGTRLRASNAAQTLPVVKMVGRSKMNNVAVIGAGMSTAQHTGVEVSGNGAVIELCTIAFNSIGIDGKYGLAIVTNNAIYQNRGDGIRDLLDSQVQFNTVNANGGRGVYYGGGSGSGHLANNRIEWNNGDGLNIFQAGTLAVVGNFVDRNGLAGIRVQQSARSTVTGNTIRRNGRLAAGSSNDDCNLYLASNTGLVVSGNATGSGADDNGGGGYNSPLNCVRTQNNVDMIVVGNNLQGATSASYVGTSGANDTNTVRYGNQLLAGSAIEQVNARAQVGTVTSNVNATTTGAFAFKGETLSTNSIGHIYDLSIFSRDASTTFVRAATMKVLVQRPTSADAAASIQTFANINGTDFGLTGARFNVLVTTNATGETITVNIENTSANTVGFRVRLV